MLNAYFLVHLTSYSYAAQIVRYRIRVQPASPQPENSSDTLLGLGEMARDGSPGGAVVPFLRRFMATRPWPGLIVGGRLVNGGDEAAGRALGGDGEFAVWSSR